MKLTFICFFVLFSCCSFAQEYQLSKPIVNAKDNGFFQEQAEVKLDFKLKGATLRYTLNGTEPTRSSKRYKKPIIFNESGKLNIKAFKKGFLPSETVFYELIKVEDRIEKIEIDPMPNERYAGNGAMTLSDLKSGALNFADGNWLGYNSGPITITIDLGQLELFNEVVLSSLSDPGSWILPPEYIEMLTSVDGISYVQFSNLKTQPLLKAEASRKKYYSIKGGNQNTRYIQLIVSPVAQLPEWHPGKGNSAWVFIDEIIIR